MPCRQLLLESLHGQPERLVLSARMAAGVAGPARADRLLETGRHPRLVDGVSGGFQALLNHLEHAAWAPAIDSTYPLEEIAG